MSVPAGLRDSIHDILDVDGDGEIDLDDALMKLENIERDSIDKELERIRRRRTDGDKRFPKTFDDLVLIIGVISGIIFFGGVLLLSSGGIASDSILLDKALSKTPLDTGEPCVDREGEIWFNIWASHEEIFVRTHNAEGVGSVLVISLFHSENDTLANQPHYEGGLGNIHSSFTLSETHPDGDYEMRISFFQNEENLALEVNDEEEFSAIHDTLIEVSSKQVSLVVTTHLSGGPLSSDERKEARIIDSDPRACWTMEGLGDWGWILMGAEWAGGRETAMLTGGSAGVPAWWMAFISLGMSIFFLCVQYPLMHRMYHRDQDDILTPAQFKRLVNKTLKKAESELRIEIQFDNLQMQERPISVDIYIPFLMTRTTIGDYTDIRTGLTKALLEEFAIFGEMRPLQIKSICVDDSSDKSLDEMILASDLSLVGSDSLPLAEDYGPFFSNLSVYGNLEEAVHESMIRWFKNHDLVDYGTAIMVDDDALMVRVIYRPVQRFTYFRFGKTYIDMEDDLRAHLNHDLVEILGERELIISARNEKSTLSDRALAGRVELGSEEFSGEAMVARQGGITGALLQNPFMGDILSSVEYVAYRNRSRIDKYGFWGLIVFVWIPFMASGVLVGAMLGLVARMRFQRVLFACLVGGAAASITWAYTARGIIEFMERYHADFFIPFVILLAFVFTVLHLRRNKRYRREELFRESIAFFAGASTSN